MFNTSRPQIDNPSLLAPWVDTLTMTSPVASPELQADAGSGVEGMSAHR